MKAELWSNEETMGEGVRREGSAVAVFFLSLLLPTPPCAFSRLNLVRGCLSNTQINHQLSRLFTFLIVLTTIGRTIFRKRKQLTENVYSTLYYFCSSTINNFHYMNVKRK